MKNKNWIITGTVLGFIGVEIGALGAHGLRESLSAEMLEVFKTGVFYHLLHTVVILAIGLSGRRVSNLSAIFFLLGIFLFSFSLYLYAVTGLKWLALITPFGGVSFLIAWLWLIPSVLREFKKG